MLDTILVYFVFIYFSFYISLHFQIYIFLKKSEHASLVFLNQKLLKVGQIILLFLPTST
tara:strand:+ start:491 stop:667 length:177 start_codon:yes stop_codon:yes gene_type:complete